MFHWQNRFLFRTSCLDKIFLPLLHMHGSLPNTDTHPTPSHRPRRVSIGNNESNIFSCMSDEAFAL